ncbi:hypothetical protein BS420_21755, partial [Cronobacter sakazakii]
SLTSSPAALRVKTSTASHAGSRSSSSACRHSAREARHLTLAQFLIFLLLIKLNMKIIKSKALDDYS